MGEEPVPDSLLFHFPLLPMAQIISYSLSLKKLETMAQVKELPFGLKQRILTVWQAAAFSAMAGGSFPALMTELHVSVSCSMQLLNFSVVWADNYC